jgi:hypothetical protein
MMESEEDEIVQDVLQRMIENFSSRLTGPMQFRLYLQPAMAIFFGIRDGIKDASEGKPAYFWTISKNKDERWKLLKDGLRAVGRVFLLGILMDAIFQLIVFKWFYPTEALLVALILAFIPYMLVRGPVNRITKWRSSHSPHPHSGVGASR